MEKQTVTLALTEARFLRTCMELADPKEVRDRLGITTAELVGLIDSLSEKFSAPADPAATLLTEALTACADALRTLTESWMIDSDRRRSERLLREVLTQAGRETPWPRTTK
jgi:hypothetical protein